MILYHTIRISKEHDNASGSSDGDDLMMLDTTLRYSNIAIEHGRFIDEEMFYIFYILNMLVFITQLVYWRV